MQPCASGGTMIDQWFEVKSALALWSGLDRDSLHIYAAVLIQLGTALLLRHSLASPWPWLAVFAVVLANEAVDLSQFAWDAVIPKLFWDAVILDIWNSMLLPSLLFLLARFAPKLLTARAPRR
jgi:hypothetical protein